MYHSICHLASTCFSLTQQPQPYLRLSDWWLSCCLKQFAHQVAAEAPMCWHIGRRRGECRGGWAHPSHAGWGGFIFGECQSHGEEVSWQQKRLSYTPVAYTVTSDPRVLYTPLGLFWELEWTPWHALMSNQTCDPEGLHSLPLHHNITPKTRFNPVQQDGFIVSITFLV